MSAVEPTPVPPTLSSEFYLWLWHGSQERSGRFDLGATGERIELYVEDRLAFRSPGETRVSAVLTGDNPAETIEARAAVFGGKILQECRIRIRRDDQDYVVTLKGPEMHLTGIKLPPFAAESESEAIVDRMARYDELAYVVGQLFEVFCAERTSSGWEQTVEPALRAWVQGGVRG